MKVRDVVWEEGTVREIYLEEGDLVFVVEGYEFEEDEMREGDYEPEFEGEAFYRTYTDFKEAIEKYMELVKAGWEVVMFRIKLKEGFTLKNTGFFVMFNTDGKSSSLNISINSTKLCESYAKKLAKIQEIIESGEI